MATRKGLEPSTSGVTGRRSNQLNYRARQFAGVGGGNNRARTCDPMLVRHVLYQLSYAPRFLPNLRRLCYYTRPDPTCQQENEIFCLENFLGAKSSQAMPWKRISPSSPWWTGRRFFSWHRSAGRSRVGGLGSSTAPHSSRSPATNWEQKKWCLRWRERLK